MLGEGEEGASAGALDSSSLRLAAAGARWTLEPWEKQRSAVANRAWRASESPANF